MEAILGIKQGMMQTFTPSGRRAPVTIVKSGPNVVTQIKTAEKDGYWAIQLGFGAQSPKRISKPLLGHLQKALSDKTAKPSEKKNADLFPRYLKEIRLDSEPKNLKVGQQILPSDVLKPGDLVQVTGISKGKGFAGVVKRWGFAGGPRTHGQSDRLRAPGAIGQGTNPGRVWKGKKMAGRMGTKQVTVKNLLVLSVSDDGEVQISGSVPGSRGNLLFIKKTGKAKNFEETYKVDEQVKSAESGKETDNEDKD